MHQGDRVRAWSREEAERFLKRARKAAAKHGAGQEADDIAQAAILSWLEGKSEGQTVSQAVLDAMRARFKRGIARMEEAELVENIHAADQNDGLDFERLLDGLESRDRAILKLKYQWGFEGTEIADLFGVTRSRVSHMLSSIEGKLKERLEKWK